ncbi:HalOD1 output domain-containing protein [Halopiger xanaduensis]|uniref:Halobacterial output domain-containing protein n=1 Tax=Halopiger xanaduensis (strain DSM 18323 / JCM 14033 / SH-6) TaxID=797210 RepID=F8D8Y4_HALXS|nr:HalOD1 output domain-containing protein [Halopiger xanaduensis]AEH37095.1 hypothetical protein Halxa_2476 [Halopiger xanaduensis SH-6]
MATQSSQSADDEPPSVRVARELAARDGVDPTELSPPLYHSLDTAALDALFEPTRRGGLRHGRITFAYNEKWVTVHDDGEITVEQSGTDPETDSQ